jgi:hypothetical protein
LALAALLAITFACGGSVDQVQNGQGRIPGSVPDDFPVPTQAVVTESVVDAANHRTEFTLEVASDSLGLLQFFTIELVSQGYVIDRSMRLDEETWEVVFSRNEVAGSILIMSDGGGHSLAVVSMNVS